MYSLYCSDCAVFALRRLLPSINLVEFFFKLKVQLLVGSLLFSPSVPSVIKSFLLVNVFSHSVTLGLRWHFFLGCVIALQGVNRITSKGISGDDKAL